MKFIRYTVPILLSFTTLLLSSFKTHDALQQKSRLRKIVIDPGHGGFDSGAKGRYSSEKDIALAISLKLEKLLQDQIPDVEIAVTRKSDIYQSPVTKANIANQAKGDLFVCIHCNDAPPKRVPELTGYKTVTTGKGKNKKKKQVPQYRYNIIPSTAQGTETYIWGTNKTGMKEKAMRENQSLYLDSASARYVKDFDPNSIEQMQFISLKTRVYFDRSMNLALTIEDEFTKVGRVSREAQQRQVGIWVLQAVAMPAVLVETGFLSNPTEEDYLNSKDGQTEVAQCIVDAIKRYRYSLDNKLITTGGATAPAKNDNK
ncbi:N-acetylmuramoyl-L-alanine amidase [Chitinophagaceae bacterium LWZ2-11]